MISFLPSLKLNLKCFVEISLILRLFAKFLPNNLTFILWVSAGCWNPVLSTAPHCQLSGVPGLLHVEANWFPLFSRNRAMATCTQIISSVWGCLQSMKSPYGMMTSTESPAFPSCVKWGNDWGVWGCSDNCEAVTAQWLPNYFTAALKEKKLCLVENREFVLIRE